MDSGSFQHDPCSINDDAEQEFYSIRTRQRTATKQIQRRNISTRKPGEETELHLESALLGENGLGLTAEEFITLPDSERKQLLEAVLQSKEEYKMQETKSKSERLESHVETSTNKTIANSMPVKVECSIRLPRVVTDTATARNERPSLNKFRLKRPSEVAAEDKVHMETTVNSHNLKKIKCNEDYLAESEASVAELVSSDEHSNIDAEKCTLTADKPRLGVIYFAEKNEDSSLRKVYQQDCSGVQESNSLDLLTSERNFQLRTRNSDRFQTKSETSYRCLLLENDENGQMAARDVSASLRASETIEEKFFDCPDSPTSCQLIRKYRVQAIDKRPLFKQNGLDLEARVRVIYDYYTDCEIKCYKSSCKTTSVTQWGKPIAIELDKGKVTIRNRRLRGDITEEEQMNDKSLHKNENQTSDYDFYSAVSNENEEVRKRLVLPVEQVPSSSASSETMGSNVEMDNLLTQEDIKTRLRKSRQTKIGGGLVEDEDAMICQRKMSKRAFISTVSDDENDPDFTPENKKKRIHVDRERSHKPEKQKRRRLGVVKSTGKHSRKTEEQITEGCKALEWNEVGSDEGEGEVQEPMNLAKGSSWKDAGKCQTTTVPKCNANNTRTHSSTSPEGFYETRSAVVSTLERHKFVINNTLINSNTVNRRDLDQCQINADLEDGLLKNDTNQQVFPVFQKLVRPCLRETERSTDSRAIPSTCKNSNSEQNEGNEEVLSGDSSEGDDCDLDKSTKTKSFAIPSFRIPKVMEMCPLCQKDFLMSSLEEHVQKCVQLDDERKSNQMVSDRS